MDLDKYYKIGYILSHFYDEDIVDIILTNGVKRKGIIKSINHINADELTIPYKKNIKVK